MPRSKGRQSNRKAAVKYPQPSIQTGNNTPAQQPDIAKESISAPVGSMQRRLTQRQEAAQKRLQRRRRLQILIAGLVVVLLAVAAIIAIQFANAPATFTDLPATASTDPAPFTLGNPDAKVTLIEYADFRCPACESYFKNDEKTIRDKYVATGKVKYVFKNFTVIDDLVGDTGSLLAAQAGFCASEQNRFWDFHDAMYNNFVGEKKGVPTEKYLEDLARALKLNGDQFDQCLTASKNRQQIVDEKASAVQKGVTGTPTFFVQYGDKEEMIQAGSSGFAASIGAKLDEVLKSVDQAK